MGGTIAQQYQSSGFECKHRKKIKKPGVVYLLISCLERPERFPHNHTDNIVFALGWPLEPIAEDSTHFVRLGVSSQDRRLRCETNVLHVDMIET